MMEKSRISSPSSSPRHREKPTNRSRRYLVPIAGAVSVTLGLSFAIAARFPGDVYLPLVLVSLGVGVLSSALGSIGPREPLATAAATSSERFIADTLVICPSCSARSFEPVATLPPAASTGAWRVPDPVPGALATGPAHAVASTPGDFLWGSWASETGRLPVELVGPVAETAYVAPRPGAPTLYEEGEPVMFEPVASSTPATETRASSSVSAVSASAPVMPRPEIEDSESTLVMGLSDWRSVGSSVLEYTSADVVLWEAMNPTPPHLRAPSTPRAAPTPVSRSARSQAIPSGQCADCAELVPDPANWRRCLECGHLLCSVCMVDALVSRERPWCSRCAEARHLVAQ
jgi:hypothetical protein